MRLLTSESILYRRRFAVWNCDNKIGKYIYIYECLDFLVLKGKYKRQPHIPVHILNASLVLTELIRY